jgi:DNA-binding transcriptional regulator YiaG
MRVDRPSPETIRAWRRERNLSARDAAALVHTTARVWLQWEAGDRRMHPAFWALAQMSYPARPLAVHPS